jgi:glutathione peroxidase
MKNDPRSALYGIDCIDLTGKPLPIQQFTGRPMLIINTASLCSFSTQFADLESLWQRNKERGLVVLGVPSNDFGHQEPGNSEQIVSLCLNKFGVTFPMLAKTPVRGAKAHPLFQWLAQEGGFFSKPRWNFYKYIIGRDGHLKDWFSTIRSPGSHHFETVLDGVIKANA